jgi:hypothetical protein
MQMEPSVEDRPEADSGPFAAEGEHPSREPRRARLLVCDMRLANGRVAKVRIRNISTGGMGGRSEIVIEPWQRVALMLPAIGTVAGRIAWVRHGLFGIQFDSPIDPDQAVVVPTVRQSDHVVPPRYQPATDFRRPGMTWS